MQTTLYDLSPIFRVLLIGALVASVPALWVYLRDRSSSSVSRYHALVVITLFLTFDLVLFGAFTRLTDSGLGCPDWPGCYGNASPLGATHEIAMAQTAMPSGPVTHSKAWIEMVHRYMATSVGALITLMVILAWRGRKQEGLLALSPWWPTATLVWVCIQGAFGALTVTMKLFPAIVSLHLLGGYVLLALLMAQVAVGAASSRSGTPIILQVAPTWVYRWAWAALLMLTVQAASGAWVSTNYAVLACAEFPGCQGVMWPPMDWKAATEIWRPLGLTASGDHLSFQALTAIHMAHRLLAGITVLVLGSLAWTLWKQPALKKPAQWLTGLLVLQLATGLSNVVLGWPLLAAVMHTGGAGAMVMVLVWVIVVSRTRPVGR
ncbi:Heme A synthase [Curvibacter sp. AEP1-3]|uniref:COX15/CtaA family protein n=1 Tax=Curvibacter sp. AEP1-3 TaxID=1844971 RepID=UPI000B5553CB|nr:COX15/CtaA family protein [Curvibacter sp. AEP1-3]ARV20218.1 Heme A synthase [Curvibacter sp. AEP1-3]